MSMFVQDMSNPFDNGYDERLDNHPEPTTEDMLRKLINEALEREPGDTCRSKMDPGVVNIAEDKTIELHQSTSQPSAPRSRMKMLPLRIPCIILETVPLSSDPRRALLSELLRALDCKTTPRPCIEELNLRGTGLNNRNLRDICEKLIVGTINTKRITLAENTRLGDKCLALGTEGGHLLAALKSSTVIDLDISRCGLREVGIKLIAEASLVHLKKLNISHNQVGSRGCESLARWLGDGQNHLQILKICSTALSMGPGGINGFITLVNAIITPNSMIQGIDISHNTLTTTTAGLASIREVLSNRLHGNSFMRSLSLDGTLLDKESSYDLGKAIHDMADSRRLEKLSLSECRLGDYGVRGLVEGLLGRSLEIPESEDHVDNAHQISDLEQASSSVLCARAAELRQSSNSESMGARGRRSTQNLELDLSINDFGPGGAVAVAELLQHCDTQLGASIVSLSLTGNPLGVVGMVKLTPGIQKAASLRRLDLQSTQLFAAGAVWLCNALEKTWGTTAFTPRASDGILEPSSPFVPPLALLNLNGNSIGQRGGSKLLSLLAIRPNCHPLRALGLRNNHLGPKVTNSFAVFLRQIDCHLVWVEFSQSDLEVPPAQATNAGAHDEMPAASPLLAVPAQQVGVRPWPLSCRLATIGALEQARHQMGESPLPPEVVSLVFSYLCSVLVRRVAIQ